MSETNDPPAIPPNPESKKLKIAWAVLATCALILSVLGMMGLDRLERSRVLMVLGVGCAVTCIGLFSVIIMTLSHWLLYRRCIRDENLLALWFYSEKEADQERESGLKFTAIVASVIAAFALFLFHDQWSTSASARNTAFTLAIGGVVVVLFLTWLVQMWGGLNFAVISRCGGYCVFGSDGNCLGWSPDSLGPCTELTEKDGRLSLDITLGNHSTDEGIRKRYLSIPVPAGREDEAARLKDMLG